MSEAESTLILLDTHIWIWYVAGDARANSHDFLKLMSEKISAASVRVSIISIWEIGILTWKNRLTLTYPPLEWVHRALALPGTLVEPISPEIAIDSSYLAGDFHGDPADRILIATAKNLNATLISEDKNILSYCRKHHLPVRAIR